MHNSYFLHKLSTSVQFLQKISLLIICSLLVACASKPIVLYDEARTDHTKTASLILPVELDIIYYNGKKQQFITPFRPNIEYHIAQGDQIIGLQYSNIFPNSEYDDQIVKSPTVFVQFHATAAETYLSKFEKPADLMAAEEFVQNFEPIIYSGNQVVSRTLQNYTPVGGDNFFSELLAVKSGDGDINEAHSEEESPLAQLKYWWSKTSSAQRDIFDEWRKTQ